MSFELFVLLLLFLANGVFALSEIALVSARKSRLEQKHLMGSVGAGQALHLIQDQNRFLSTVQVGITLVGTVAGVFGGARFAGALAAWLSTKGLPAEYAEGVALAIVVLGITYLSLMIGELVPKRIALHDPERIACLVAGPMRAISRIAAPAVWLLSSSTEMLFRLLPLKPKAEAVTEDDIRALIRQGTNLGVLKKEEQDMLVDDRRVSVLMTPRRDIVYFERIESHDKIASTIRENRYSRYPVCDGGIDNIVGIVHLRELFRVPMEKEVDFTPLLVEPLFVLDTTRALNLLRQFKLSGVHVAIVHDEYGGVQGLVTLNDLFETIVGSLPEFDETEGPAVVQRQDGSWLVNGSVPIEDVRSMFPAPLLPVDVQGGYETLGGFVMTQLGRIPDTGDHFAVGPLRFEVVDMDERRVDKVLIQRIEEGEDAQAGSGSLEQPDGEGGSSGRPPCS
ncbi:MAG: HlyC/CorC family transporter [Candidatus Hydrogenedentes bacterium]|nr:HlyC/CorC family transporter [Candidatus Hydrogenedentota bacterium]